MARTAQFATLSFSVNEGYIPTVQQLLQERLDSFGATEILFSTSGGFVSCSFVLHGSHATESGFQSVQHALQRQMRDFRAQELLLTGEPEAELT